MTVAPGTDWRQEFGLSDRTPPRFFASKEDIDAAGAGAPQPHALRRAFELLELAFAGPIPEDTRILALRRAKG